MKRVMTTVAFVAAMTAMGAANAADMDALKEEAKGVVMAFGGPLKQTLGGSMKEGGPVNAIGVCNEKAVGIANEAAAKTGWHVARTSLKLRNSNNKPDSWELNVLNMFEEKQAAGAKMGTLAFAEVVETNGKKQFRFMKAIGTVDVCLNCHGMDIKPDVAAKLDALYPDDKARGFAVGDIRGAFTLRKDL